MSAMMPTEDYERFSEIFVPSIFMAGIYQFAIGYASPRLRAVAIKNSIPAEVVIKIADLALCLLVLFNVVVYVLDFRQINFVSSFIATIFSGFLNALNISFTFGNYKRAAAFGILTIPVIWLAFIIVFYFGLAGETVLLAFLSGCFFIFRLVLYSNIKMNISLLSVLKFLKLRDVSGILIPAAISGFIIGAIYLGLFNYFIMNSPIEIAASIGFALLLRQGLQFASSSFNRLFFNQLTQDYVIERKDGYREAIIQRLLINVASFMVSIVFFFIVKLVFYDFYFYKFSYFGTFSILLVFIICLLDVFYGILYQKVQIFGYMWHSLFYIVIPMFVVCWLLIKSVEILSIGLSVELYLCIYIILGFVMVVSAAALNWRLRGI